MLQTLDVELHVEPPSIMSQNNFEDAELPVRVENCRFVLQGNFDNVISSFKR